MTSKNYTLITGAKGFIGNATYLRLKDRKNIICLDKNFDKNEIQKIKEDENIALSLDLRKDETYLFLKKYNISKIIHLAAFAGVRDSIERPNEYWENNVEVTKKILNFMNEKNINNFVFSSSSSVYGNYLLKNKDQKLLENLKLETQFSPYAKTKLTSEINIMNFQKKYNKFKYIILRYFTVYGPNQRKDLAISKFINLIKENKEITKYGKGDSFRDYTFIDDIVEANIKSLDNFNKKNVVNEIYNVCSGEKITLNELILELKSHFKNIIIKNGPNQEGDAFGTFGDNQKIKKNLNWNPKYNFKKGMNKWIEKFNIFLYISNNNNNDNFKKINAFLKNQKLYKVLYSGDKIDKELSIDNNLFFSNNINKNIVFNNILWRANFFIDKEFFKKFEYEVIYLNFNKENKLEKINITKQFKENPFFSFYSFEKKKYEHNFIDLYIKNNNREKYLNQIEKIKEKENLKNKGIVDSKIKKLFDKNLNKKLGLKKQKIINCGNEGIIALSEDKEYIYKWIKEKKEKYSNKKLGYADLKLASPNLYLNTMVLPKTEYNIEKIELIDNKKNVNYCVFKYKNSIIPINEKISFENIFWLLFNQKKSGLMIDDIKIENLGIDLNKSYPFKRIIYNDIGRSIFEYKDNKWWEGLIRDYLIFHLYQTDLNCKSIIKQKRKNKEYEKEIKNLKTIKKIINKKIKIYNSIDGRGSREILPNCICSMGFKKFYFFYEKRLNDMKSQNGKQYVKICNWDSKDTLSFKRKKNINKEFLLKLNWKTNEIIICKKIKTKELKTKFAKEGIELNWTKKKDFTYEIINKNELKESWDHFLWELKTK